MTVIIDGTAGVTFPVTAGSASAVQASSGRVLQVVQATTTTVVTRTTAGAVDTTLTATITPSSASNKILIAVHQNGVRKQSADTYMEISLLRGSSVIAYIAYAQGYSGSTAVVQGGTVSISYLDSPATTSATTYKTQFNNVPAAGNVNVQVNNDVSTITLMEIAA